ncbi:ArsR/SmtB family transcription factor [Sediminivirga luteola]|uniref:Transcriptional regulator n=1 Tax=Sediminivirga luteola TaxID=1774748 RepID=A0A8J2TUK7_9MICO|nr:metalloregulator ArsR/SmtB family transcription factor [Sediminivirga luteola]MCI2266136.1 metalloregulator ArsR/SmtB family transcription factor [Sediminivirga luteola]GGA01701.1 transcriptional regulator [Sediminivirga luteola]
MSQAHSPAVVFAALGDDTRWEILQRVGARAASASALAVELPVTRQAVARHLEVLHAAGLVEKERHGRELRYRAIAAALSAAAAELEQIAAGWDRRLERLRARAEKED